jgi:prevent-host-death family protein
MDRSVSASEANRQFSRILREVSEGESYTVTSHGRPVARIVPADAVPDRSAARKRLFDRLESQPAMNLGKFNRDEAYD